MVVDDVEEDGESSSMAGVDESLEGVGSAVGFVDGGPQDPVVTPAMGAVEGVERHEFDVGDSEFDQVVEVVEGGGEGALGGEGAHMEFVDHAPGQRAPGPVVIGPVVGVMIVDAAGSVDAFGLPQRARVGQGLCVLVEEVGVVGSRAGPGNRGVPPAAVVAAHGVVDTVHSDVDALGMGCPDREVSVDSASGGGGRGRLRGRFVHAG